MGVQALILGQCVASGLSCEIFFFTGNSIIHTLESL